MTFSLFTKRNTKIFYLLATAAFLMAASALPAAAEYPATTLNTLLDRTQIEDLLVDYYSQLGSGGSNYGSFYVADGVLDVNGIVCKGQKEIEGLYKKSAGGEIKGTFRMLLTNIKIVVNGNTATADVIWTGVNSENIKAAPKLVEQGREHDDLVKQNGRWYFKHRVITADSGLSAMYDKTYKKR